MKRRHHPFDHGMDPAYLTLSEAAQRLHISLATCYRLAPQGKIPGAKKVGRKWRVSVNVLDDAFRMPTLSLEARKALLHALPIAIER